jgi:hypothetical protein
MNEQYPRSEDGEAGSTIAVSDVEWESRQLCDDGNCTGVIGGNGCCKQCGRAKGENSGKRSSASGAESMDANGHQPENDLADDALNAGDPDWANRILCGDGNCIGVIGPDGICKECGKPLETSAAGSL